VGIRRLHIFRIPRRDSLGSRNCIVAVDFSPYNSSQWEHGRDLVEGQRQMVSLLPNPQFVEVFHRQRPPLHGSGAIVGCDPSLSSDQVAARLAGSDLEMCRAQSSHTKREILFWDRPPNITRCLNAIEELVGTRDGRDKDRAYAAQGKQLTNLLESHRRLSRRRAWRSGFSLSPRFNPTSPSPITGFDLPPGLITQTHYRPCRKTKLLSLVGCLSLLS
jgi:hypothetical protein